MGRYNSYRAYLRDRFGIPVLKVPVNGGFSCPNRDGTKSRDGCAFCENASFSPVAGDASPPVEQLQRALDRAHGRFAAFLPYLQPYTNTHAPPGRLAEVYEPLISHPGVVGLAVGTRPDCLPPDTVDYLADVASRTYLCVEIGLQSACDETLAHVNRGHTFADFADAAQRLAARGIEVVAHVMIGLPGEGPETIAATAAALARLPVTGVKPHQVMVIAGTAMERWHAEGRMKTLTLDKYAEFLCLFLSRIRPDQHVHRLVADCRPERGLVAPLWSADKAAAVAHIHAFMERTGFRQGADHASAPDLPEQS